MKPHRPRLSFERARHHGVWLPVVLGAFMLVTAVALVFVIAGYHRRGAYREQQVRAVLDSSAAALSAWIKDTLQTNQNASFVTMYHVQGVPPYSFALTQLVRSAEVTLVERFLAGQCLTSLPPAALTGDAATHVIGDPTLARRVQADPAAQIAIGWQMAADAARCGDTNTALGVYRLMQDVFAHDIDAHGFPVRMMALLEELSLNLSANETGRSEAFGRALFDADVRPYPQLRTVFAFAEQRFTNLRMITSAEHDVPSNYCSMTDLLFPPRPPDVVNGTPDSSTGSSFWLSADRLRDAAAAQWLPPMHASASNALVSLIVGSTSDPAPVAEYVATNLLGVTLILVPFDAARWEARQRTRAWVQSSLLVLLLAVLAWLFIRAVRLAAAERELGRRQLGFVAAVSHELRTPIAAVRALAETLHRGKVTDRNEQAEYADMIIHESDRLTRLVDNILDVARPRSGQPNRNGMQDVTVRALVESAVAAFARTAADHGIALRISHGTDARVHGDRHALERVLHNLIDNAIKYSGKASAIDITTAADTNFATIAVRDYGVGIAPQEHGRIFDRFYRVGDELVRETPGAGLGLAIVREIVIAHGGSVAVDSAPGSGSTFTVRLPLTTRGNPADPADPSDPSDPSDHPGEPHAALHPHS